MAIPDVTPNTQRFIAYAGTGNRMAQVDANGNMSATQTIITGKLSDATAISLLTTESNWNDVGVYIGTAITGTYEGQYYATSSFEYYAYSDNVWHRKSLTYKHPIVAKNGDALPSTYPIGITSMEVGVSQTNWPATYGNVITFATSTGRMNQIFYQIVGNYDVYIRSKTSSGADTWQNWFCVTTPVYLNGYRGRKIPRVRTIATTGALTVYPDFDNDDVIDITGLTGALTLGAPTGTPVNKQAMMIDIYSASAQTINAPSGTYYAAGGVAFPTTTVAGKITSLLLVYSNSLLKLRSVAQEA